MDKQQFRDMCAAMALQGLVQSGLREPGAVAVRAFDIAEAMAAERERRGRDDAAGLVDRINRGLR